MIITQTRQRRSFVGSMNAGVDVIEALSHICIDNAIFCANFSAVGYVRNPVIRTYSVARKGFEPDVEHHGLLHVVALHGNVSLRERQTVIRCHVVGTLRETDEEPRLVGGELAAGEVVSFEFSLTTIDDIRLYRADDDRTGLEPWLQMDLGTGPPAPEGEAPEVPVIVTGPGSEPPHGAGRAKEQPLPDEPLDVRPGDSLHHPTLGTCEVLAGTEERVTIRLESGRTVELHLGLLTLEATGAPGPGGSRTFRVNIRRRR